MKKRSLKTTLFMSALVAVIGACTSPTKLGERQEALTTVPSEWNWAFLEGDTRFVTCGSDWSCGVSAPGPGVYSCPGKTWAPKSKTQSCQKLWKPLLFCHVSCDNALKDVVENDTLIITMPAKGYGGVDCGQ